MGPRILPREDRQVEQDRRWDNDWWQDDALIRCILDWADDNGFNGTSELSASDLDEVLAALKEVVRGRGWMIDELQILDEWIEDCFRNTVGLRNPDYLDILGPRIFRPIDGPDIIVPDTRNPPGHRTHSPESMTMHEIDNDEQEAEVDEEEEEEENEIMATARRIVDAGNFARSRRARRRSLRTYRPGQVLRGAIFTHQDGDDESVSDGLGQPAPEGFEDYSEPDSDEDDDNAEIYPGFGGDLTGGATLSAGPTVGLTNPASSLDLQVDSTPEVIHNIRTQDSHPRGSHNIDIPSGDSNGSFLPPNFRTSHGLMLGGWGPVTRQINLSTIDVGPSRPADHPAYYRIRRPSNDDPFGMRQSRYSSNRVRQYISSRSDYQNEPYTRRTHRHRGALSRNSLASEVVFQMSEAASRFEDTLGQVLGEMGDQTDSQLENRARPGSRRLDSMQERSAEFARAADRGRQTGRTEQEDGLDDRRAGQDEIDSASENRLDVSHPVEGSDPHKLIPGPDGYDGTAYASVIRELAAETLRQMPTSSRNGSYVQLDEGSIRQAVWYTELDRGHRFPPMIATDPKERHMSMSRLSSNIKHTLRMTLTETHRYAAKVAFGLDEDSYQEGLLAAGLEGVTTRRDTISGAIKYLQRKFRLSLVAMLTMIDGGLAADCDAMEAALRETNQGFGLNWDAFGSGSLSSSSRSGSALGGRADDFRDDKHERGVYNMPVPRGDDAMLRIDVNHIWIKFAEYIANVFSHLRQEEYNDYVYTARDLYLDSLQRSTFGMKTALLVRVFMNFVINMVVEHQKAYMERRARLVTGLSEKLEGDLVQEALELMQSTAGSADEVRRLREGADGLLRSDDRKD